MTTTNNNLQICRQCLGWSRAADARVAEPDACSWCGFRKGKMMEKDSKPDILERLRAVRKLHRHSDRTRAIIGDAIAEIINLRNALGLLQRKVAHGCTDAFCSECD